MSIVFNKKFTNHVCESPMNVRGRAFNITHIVDVFHIITFGEGGLNYFWAATEYTYFAHLGQTVRKFCYTAREQM